jgi:hypothetical protein
VGLVTNVVVAQLSRPEQMTRNMMINDIGGSVGSSLGTYLTYLLTALPFHVLLPFECTLEVQVTIVVAIYGLLLGTLVLCMMPRQRQLVLLYQAAAAPDLPCKVQQDRGVAARKGSAAVVAGCLAMAAADAVAYRCNVSNLVLVLPQEYGFSTVDTSNVLGIASLAGSAAMMLMVAMKVFDGVRNEWLIYGCTMFQLIACGLLLRIGTSDSYAYALWFVMAFQITGLGNQTKANALKSHMTCQDVFEKKDVLMVSRLFTMLTAFIGPIAGRYVAETCTAQNVVAVFGGVSLCMQLVLWTGIQTAGSVTAGIAEANIHADDLEAQCDDTLPVLLGRGKDTVPGKVAGKLTLPIPVAC